MDMIRGHRNDIFVPFNGFCPLRGGGDQHLAVNFCKFGTKISTRKSRVAYVVRENKRQREVNFYLFCVYKRQTEYQYGLDHENGFINDFYKRNSPEKAHFSQKCSQFEF